MPECRIGAISGSMSRSHFHARFDAPVPGDAPDNHAGFLFASRLSRPPIRTGMGEGRSDFYALDNRWPGFKVVNESSPRRTPRSRPAWMVWKMLVGLANK
jgi:hypothetical protein